ncbi:aminoglycoside phosphotransferase family protein [Couchioplanes caeruleus]|uniref:aminoglycoside phosphotransferase family protein n=1 Tax=Couchioplanes caeruleus TaxID=56438 RepID=UPI0020BE515E|nr:aminoglycoside phosphotransferase family protein [Couchioplanes caeruleus]UQU66821.1 aminoglycoside phosphotransferase family protein [Couchioplanes caeruleus]
MTPERLRAILAGLQAQTGLSVAGAHLIKFTNNAVFRLPKVSAVARIAGSETMAKRVNKVVRVAGWLEDEGVAAVQLLRGVPQPVVVDGLLVTVWQDIEGPGRPPTGEDLAKILKVFHRLLPPDGGLPGWAPIEEIRQRLDDPEGVSADDVAFLRAQCDEIEAALANVSFELPQGPIHGDAFMGNLITSPTGPVICDFDSTCIGPREWDLTPLAVGKLRFNYARDAYSELIGCYGFDVMKWPGFAVLRRVRELKLVASVVPVLASNPAIREQWKHRLSTYRSGDQTTRWSTYSSTT